MKRDVESEEVRGAHAGGATLNARDREADNDKGREERERSQRARDEEGEEVPWWVWVLMFFVGAVIVWWAGTKGRKGRVEKKR